MRGYEFSNEENHDMVDQEPIAILRQGVGKWNRWRKLCPRSLADLSGANLSGTYLIGANLSGAYLIGANLSSTNLSGVNFIGTDLSFADLSYTKLIGTDLGGANLSRATLTGANLSRAILTGANISHADLTDATLTDADLSRANFSFATLTGAILTGAILTGAILTGANLDGANLDGANLDGANLDGANLSQTILWNTVFGNVDLRLAKGLETVEYQGPSTIGTNTLELSQGDIPEVFLRGIGLSDTFIEYARSLVQKPIQYYTCFISYSSKDEAFAKRLYSDLQSEGVRCWFAPEDMDIGDKIKHRIDTSIRLYDKLLLILSEHSIASTWVAYEVERALNKEPAGTPNVLYPVRLDNAIMTCKEEWAQDIKETRHIGNFEGWKANHDAYQDSFKRLLRALKSKSANT